MKKCSFHSLPKGKIQSVKIEIDESYNDDEYELTINNPLACPNRFYLSSDDKKLDELLSKSSPLLLQGNADTTLTIKSKVNLENKVRIKFKWGNPNRPIQSSNIPRLPFPEDKIYELLQGNNSNPTHNHNLSRYAFDFTMKIGDTVTAAQNGYVVTVIDGYDGWGYGDKWKSYVNQVMIYDTYSHFPCMVT